MIIKRLAMGLGVIILTLIMSLSVTAVDYTPDELADMVDSLAAAKVCYDSQEVDNLRAELAYAAAIPSEDMLSQLKLTKPVKVDGVRISDFAGFAEVFDGRFEYFGIAHEVDGREVYELIIQDAPLNDTLRSTIYQNGSLGYDIYAKKSIFQHNDGKGYTESGTSNSYSIICFIESSMHYIYVKSGGEWKLSYTTNSAEVYEYHSWLYTESAGGGKTDTTTGSREYNYSYKPDSYGNRIYIAADSQKSPRREFTVTHTSIVPMADGSEYEAFTLDIICPANTTKLVRLAENRTLNPIVIELIISAVLALAILVPVFILIRKYRRKRQNS